MESGELGQRQAGKRIYGGAGGPPELAGPRELAARHGVERLSDLDLLQALLGSGGPGLPVRRLAQAVLAAVEDPGPAGLRAALLAIRGMGEAKATQVCAALELARRFVNPERRRIGVPTDVLPIVSHYADRDQEHFLCVSLNGAHQAIRCRVVSVGLVNRTLVHPREVFAPALADRAAAIIVAHNHPSGNVEPSPEDKEITARLRQSGELLGVRLLDHLVFCADAYCSFLEEGLL